MIGTVNCGYCHKDVVVAEGSSEQDLLQDVVDGLVEEFICEACIAAVMQNACEHNKQIH